MKKLNIDVDSLLSDEEVTEEEEQQEEEVEETHEEEEEEEEQKEEEEIGFFQNINRSLGVEIETEDLEDEEKGLIEYIKRASKHMGNQDLEELFTTYPDVREYTQYRLNNGDPNKYFKTTTTELDYNNLAIEEEDIRVQKQVMRKFLEKQDMYSSDEIEEEIESYEDSGKLYKKSQIAATKLKSKNNEKRQKLLEQQQIESDNKKLERQQELERVTSTIKKGSLGNFKIPEADKSRFSKYLTGNKRMEKRDNLSLDKKLLLEYLVYNDFDISKLLKAGGSAKLSTRYSKTPSQRLNSKGKKVTTSTKWDINI